MTGDTQRPTLAVWKFASCDGCQLTLLDCEEELLALAGAVRIANFTEMSSATIEGPYDVSLVEGSDHDPRGRRANRPRARESRTLITIGACATAGGIQALRNFAQDGLRVDRVRAPGVPERAGHLHADLRARQGRLRTRGCPIDRGQLLEVLLAHLAHRRPVIAGHSVCQECKMRGTVCLLVRDGAPCLGPVTRAGCGGLCPVSRPGVLRLLWTQ